MEITEITIKHIMFFIPVLLFTYAVGWKTGLWMFSMAISFLMIDISGNTIPAEAFVVGTFIIISINTLMINEDTRKIMNTDIFEIINTEVK